MNNDLISRKAAIEAMEKSEWGYLWECEQVINVVKDLPPAEPEQKWIPVSERLPKKEKRIAKVKWNASYGEIMSFRFEGICECGQEVDHLWDYCPSCGMKLE